MLEKVQKLSEELTTCKESHADEIKELNKEIDELDQEN